MRRRKDGSPIDISLTVSPLRDANGKVIGASKVARDITDRRRAAEQRDLLTKEMGHRVKNCFAIFRSLVTLSARSATTTEEMAKELEARLAALARAHDLTRPGLLGAETEAAQPLTWRQLVHAILAPYGNKEVSTNAERFDIKGTDLPIAENALTGLALILHELATNAAKYGALSNAAGRVHISWCQHPLNGSAKFVFRWQEHRGPAVSAPEQRGFGSAVLEQVMGEYFDAPRINFATEGVSYELHGLLDTLITDPESQ